MVNGIKRTSNNIARTYGITSDDMMPTFVHKGYAPAVVNSPEWMARIREVLADAEAADRIINDKRIVDGVALNDEQIPASDDAFLLIEGIENVKGAYLGVGTADPEVYAAARKEGREFPFFAHEPNYAVDLRGIAYGTRIATVLALDVLGK
jgi:metal-dependent amidase/aminoacylase/carboxypeptidase family protein